ncbi:MAG: cation transporter [Spirochaetales bacterium]|nr:cation transporter [Spirochaetales bacterium]
MKKNAFTSKSVVTISIIVNLILFAAKYIIGVQIQSLAIKADAWHTLSDSFSSLIVIAGLWIAGRPKNEKHPFGFGRFEEITSIVVALMLGTVGLSFMKEAFFSFITPLSVTRYNLSSVIITTLTIICKEAMAQLSIRIGRKEDSRSLIADGWHHRSDAASSVVILIGIWLNRYIPRIDSILGFIVALMILYAAFEIIKDTAKSIIGETIPDELKEQIEQTARKITPEIHELHNFKYHKYGRHVEISFHGYFPEETKLKDAHDCVSRLEDFLHKESNLHCLIHPEVR